ncbi:UDP-glucose 4-epimerase [Pseudomonas asplenii]|uniref:UDP-glucose 4-epimerase n=1 Tax=Pseudomonas asplenii TaxID=53407 RepID=A0A1H1RG05_9PSED|nr:NAD-dependent epimerase/dehydratase family protein [Pseudomonas asplenii]SDS34691.1 UDP-glucose 4-epimerase [Pseudomonas asplenii]
MSTRNASEKSTLVIGGGGYIGAYLVPQLLATGRRVTVLGRSASPRFALPEEAVYVCGDFGQPALIGDLLDAHQEVIHLAYATVPNTSFENPLADLLQNLPPTVQLFAEAARRSIKLVLISSGGTVYGEAQSVPIMEGHPANPISPYGVTKLTLENYAYLYAKTHGLQFICVRPANAYGVGQRPFIGQGFISTAIASAIKGLPIKVFGDTGSVRDYLYISDAASGIVSALEFGKVSECYNLGSSIGSTNMDIVNHIRPLMRQLNCEVDVEHQAERVFDVKKNVLDSSKLTRDTGWKAKIDLLDGLVATRDWLWSGRNGF